MKLKTLKDFAPLSFKLEEFDSLAFAVQAERLKQEAIKWLKEDFKDWRSDKGLFQSEILGRWMERFNITEEDLQLNKTGGKK